MPYVQQRRSGPRLHRPHLGSYGDPLAARRNRSGRDCSSQSLGRRYMTPPNPGAGCWSGRPRAPARLGTPGLLQRAQFDLTREGIDKLLQIADVLKIRHGSDYIGCLRFIKGVLAVVPELVPNLVRGYIAIAGPGLN